MRKHIVAGNWKMFGNRESVNELTQGLQAISTPLENDAELIVFPPFIFIPDVASALSDTAIAWGAQNVSANEAGAYTGEIAAEMLTDYGCTHVLVGHSERRTLYGEDDVLVAMKFAHAKGKGLIPILCVGESLEQREQGQTEATIRSQINAVLNLESGVQLFANAVVAYEPVWAIGTGLSATPEQAQAVHAAIRALIAEKNQEIAAQLPILYGGSVKPNNANALFAQPDIDGGLIGGASLSASDFWEIAQCIK